MQNKFGLKDFVLMIMVLAVGVLVLLSMYQEDRRFTLVKDLQNTVKGQVDALARVENALGEISHSLQTGAATPSDPGYRVVQSAFVRQPEKQPAGQPEKQSGDQPTDSGKKRRPKERDESWARPEVPIQWQEPWTFATDPRKMDGFKSGGEFTEIFEGRPAKIIPHLNQDVYGQRVIDEVCQYLGAFDPKTLRMRGELADAWQEDPAGLWLRVHINPRAKFSDGTKVTSEDVRWTFHDFIKNQEIDAERVRSTMDVIQDVQVIDEQTVEFHFGEAKFTNYTQALGFEILPKVFYSKFTPTQINSSTGLLMGSGPYRVERLDPEWHPGEDVVLVRNERYWGDRSPLDSLRFKDIDDELARLTAYKNGEGDMFMPSSPQFIKVQKEAPSWNDTNYSLNWVNMRSGYSFIGWQCGPRNGKLTPFHDQRVRQGMAMIFDRDSMMRDIWGGIGEVAKGPFNPHGPASDPNLKPWPYDPEKAKALFAEAGWKVRDGSGLLKNDQGDEFAFEFTRASGGEIYERIAKYIVDQCAKSGIRCTVRVQDWSVYTETLKNRDFDAIIMGWGANAPESDLRQMFHSKSIQNEGDNFVQWSDPEADKLLDEGLKELDFDKRMKIWQKLEAVLANSQPYCFVRVPPWLRFVKKSFANVNAYQKGLEPWEFFVSSRPLPEAPQ